MKTRGNPAIKIALAMAVLLVGGWLVSRRFQIEVGVTEPDSIPIIKTDPSQASEQKAFETRPSGQTSSTASPIDKPDPAMTAAHQGTLRVSNRSSHPLRVALLSRQPKTTNTKSGETAPAGFGSPVHWDFSPSEGSEKGLLVSLPDRTVRLKKGDVVVAFAQDGSQRYWGPYIVGETAQPIWNSQSAEWELALDP
ncbi:hypothetical protein [Phormidesmis priestleyi]|nr:hypothetical protein [Phormidesmis priestleyi]